MAKMGFRKLSEMVGRCDYLEPADPLNEKVKVHFVAVLLCLISRKKIIIIVIILFCLFVCFFFVHSCWTLVQSLCPVMS